VAALTLICIAGYAQSGSENVPAGELLRRTVDRELSAQAHDHSQWMYQVSVREAGKQETKVVIETPEGDLERLRAVNGRPITAEQEEREDRRLENAIHNRRERRALKREKEEDAQRAENLFKVLPEAVTARYGKHDGDLVEIDFAPNPHFRPRSRESAVFRGMEGQIWIDTRQNRLAEIDGHLFENIKFGGGLLGHLDKGGEFHVKQSEVAAGYWEVTLMHVNMRGKALFFKTIGVQQDENRSNFRQVPDNLTLSKAREELRSDCVAGNTGR